MYYTYLNWPVVKSVWALFGYHNLCHLTTGTEPENVCTYILQKQISVPIAKLYL